MLFFLFFAFFQSFFWKPIARKRTVVDESAVVDIPSRIPVYESLRLEFSQIECQKTGH